MHEQPDLSDFEHGFATQVISKAWKDPQFKEKLLSDPRAALEEAGIKPPAGVEIKVVENTAHTAHLVLPPPPSPEISEESLALVSGGWIPAARLTFGLDRQLTQLQAFNSLLVR
jgi:hypothetical protein